MVVVDHSPPAGRDGMVIAADGRVVMAVVRRRRRGVCLSLFFFCCCCCDMRVSDSGTAARCGGRWGRAVSPNNSPAASFFAASIPSLVNTPRSKRA